MIDEFRYEDKFWQQTDAKEIVFGLIGPESQVLDLGCWTGRLGEKLKKEKNCVVVGVDINQKALAIAKKRLDKAFFCDLDKPDRLPKTVKGQKFDFVCATDVLEHLKNPSLVLRVVGKILHKNGRLIISLPNVANYSIRVKLLLGNFDYEKTGILDETHLRFFTEKSAIKMIKGCGFEVEKFFWTGRQWLPGLNAFQMIFVCK